MFTSVINYLIFRQHRYVLVVPFLFIKYKFYYENYPKLLLLLYIKSEYNSWYTSNFSSLNNYMF